MAANAPELVPWLPLVGVPLDLAFDPTPETERLDPRFRKARVEEVTSALLAVVLPTPTLLVLEDVHLMDEASADLLRHLLGTLQDRPWLVVTTRRDGQPGGFSAESGQATVVRPRPLDAADARALATAPPRTPRCLRTSWTAWPGGPAATRCSCAGWCRRPVRPGRSTRCPTRSRTW